MSFAVTGSVEYASSIPTKQLTHSHLSFLHPAVESRSLTSITRIFCAQYCLEMSNADRSKLLMEGLGIFLRLIMKGGGSVFLNVELSLN